MNHEEALDLVIDAIESEATLEVSLQGIPTAVIDSLAKQIVHALGYKGTQ